MEEELQSRHEQLSKGIKNPFILAALRGDNTGLGWKYLGGTLFVLGILYTAAYITGLLLGAISGNDITLIAAGKAQIDKNLLLIFNLIPFAVGIIGLWYTNQFFHRRTFISLITPFFSINWKKIFIAFGIYILISFMGEGAMYLTNPENYVFQLNWSKFFPLMLITFIVMPIQTSFEELLFRGYLLQGFGLLFKSSIPAVIATALFFALMHSGNPEISKFGFWTMLPFYLGFGLFLGFITIKDKSLEISLGVHAANNIFSSLFLTFKGSALETDAVFMQKEVNPLSSIPFYFASMFAFLLICTFIFGWWRKKSANVPET